MLTVECGEVVERIVAILDEAMDRAGRSWSYFTDGGPEHGLLGSIAHLSAAQASQAVGGSTIAAQVYHVVFAMQASLEWIRGEAPPSDWQPSWSVQTVRPATWDQLREQLVNTYHALRWGIHQHAGDHPDALAGALGAVTHIAYHLGAIRQKIAVLTK